MAQVDLETRGGGTRDGKVSCETLIATLPDPDPNLPPESIRISIQDYSLALAPAAVTYDRDDSAKESTNPKSQSHNPYPNLNSSRSNSQRYAGTNVKANGPILSLPNKIKHVTCTSSRPRPPTNSRIFPKKKPAKSGSKSAVPAAEPSSPKVSCFGKVLSDRERERCQLDHRRRSQDSSGCWARLAVLFSCGGAVEVAEDRGSDVARGNILLKRRNISLDEEEVDSRAVPGLGGMKRFASGRRSASWGGDVEGEGDGNVSVDLGRRSLDASWGVGSIAA